MLIKSHLVIVITFSLFFLSCIKSQKPSLQILKQTCEYSINPIAVDTQNPRFGWILSSKERGQQQSAYQILVADSKKFIEKNISNMWDSGKRQSSQTLHITYAGNPLKSNKTYYWKIKIWDLHGNESKNSKTATFHTGLLHQSDWIAKWIGTGPTEEPLPLAGFYKNKKEQYELPDTIRHDGRSVLLRKRFELLKDIKSAYAFASGLGYYELYLNGKKLGDRILAPAKTNYRKQVLYDSYDVSDKIKKGPNAIGFVLGNGWYNPYKKWWRPYRMQWFGSKKAIFQLHIEFEDGTRTILVSDDSWKAYPGPILFNCIYDGEVYDATQEYPDWNQPFCDDTKWKSVNVVAKPGGKMISHMTPPIQIVQEIKTQEILKPKPGVYVYDFGQNFAGWARLKVSGPRGSQIRMRFAEDIYPDRNIDVTSNEHAQATATYILSGNKEEVYEPRFSFFGFRYVEISGFPGEPDLDNLVGCVVHSNCESTGTFSCENELINQIHSATIWSQKSNMIGYPLDCPQRDERLGWLGDVQVTAEEAMFNFDMALFYKNWLSGIQLNQENKSGDIPIISPRPYIWDEGVEWSSTYILLLWDYYRYYADKQILTDFYNSMKQYIKFLESISKNFIIKKGWIGDWGSLVEGWEEGDPALVPTAFFFYNAKIMSKIAAVLNKENDLKYFIRLTENIKEAFNNTFFNIKTCQYQDGSQFANAFPLFIEIVDKPYRDQVLNNLINDLDKHQYHLTSGVLGTKYVPETLSKYGKQNIAYRLATQTGYPSWANMIEGRTTLSEFWNLKQSHNHVMMGSIDAWFYKYLAGIQLDENKPGFKNILIKPYIPENLNFARAVLNTIRGTVSSNWEKQGNLLHLRVSIPVTATAQLWIPKKTGQKVYENNQLITNNDWLRILQEDSNLSIVQVGSGSYSFSVE